LQKNRSKNKYKDNSIYKSTVCKLSIKKNRLQ
jgi:hypothetical protein